MKRYKIKNKKANIMSNCRKRLLSPDKYLRKDDFKKWYEKTTPEIKRRDQENIKVIR